jgi:hypothetical protein
MKKLPPINSTVTITKSIIDNDSRLGQIGTVVQYSGHGMVCVHFPDMPPGKGIFFNLSEVEE